MSTDNLTKTTFAELVGQTIMDAMTSTLSPELKIDEHTLGLLFLQRMGRAGLRVVRVTDANVLPEDITVELPTIDLPLAVRVHQALDNSTLELATTVELPALLRQQAE